MSDTPKLVDFYSEWCRDRIPSAKTRRSQQNVAKRLRLPLIKAGNSVLIDPAAGDNRLRQLAKYQEPPLAPRRGRPRTGGNR